MKRLTEADEGREHRQLGVVDAEGRRSDASRAPSATTGRAAGRAPGTPRRGTSSSRARRSTPSPRPSRSALGPARRAAARLPRRRTGSRRRLARSAVGGAPRRREGRRLRGALRTLVDLRVDDHERSDRRAAPAIRDPPAAVRQDAARGVDRRWTTTLRAELRRAPRPLGYETPRGVGGVENLEERVDGEDAVDPVVLEELRRPA